MTSEEIVKALTLKPNMPNNISLPYADGNGVDKIDVTYNDPNGDLADLMEKNGIKLTENSFTIGGSIVSPSGDNKNMEFSPNTDGSISMTVKEYAGREGASMEIGGTVTNYVIKDGTIVSEDVILRTRYNPLTTTRLINI